MAEPFAVIVAAISASLIVTLSEAGPPARVGATRLLIRPKRAGGAARAILAA